MMLPTQRFYARGRGEASPDRCRWCRDFHTPGERCGAQPSSAVLAPECPRCGYHHGPSTACPSVRVLPPGTTLADLRTGTSPFTTRTWRRSARRGTTKVSALAAERSATRGKR